MVTLHDEAVGRGDARIAALDLETGVLQPLVPAGGRAVYTANGYLVYGVGGTLMAAPFDPDRLALRGSPVPVLDRVMTKRLSGGADFAISRAGDLVYASGALEDAGAQVPVWVDREGTTTPTGLTPGGWMAARISPDGRRVAFNRKTAEDNVDIWTWEVERGALTRFTFDPGVDNSPVWSRDGATLFYAANPEGSWDVHSRPSDGTGAQRLVRSSEHNLFPEEVTPDGADLLYTRSSGGGAVTTDGRALGGAGIAIMTLGSEEEPERMLLQSGVRTFPRVSPDGRWLAFVSRDSGLDEVFVRPFPNVDDGRWQISQGGGTEPLWGATDEILYRVPDSDAVMRVSIETEAGVRFGQPELLFEAGIRQLGQGQARWDVDPRGKRFLMLKDTSAGPQEGRAELVLVQGFLGLLERLVPRVD